MSSLLIVGLGNPTPQYKYNRHNIGFMVLDHLCEDLNLSFKTEKSFKCDVARDQSIFFCKPTTFMNASGEAVLALKQYYKISEICVIHDDLDLPEGELRVKFGGSHGGHNGLRSIDALCGNAYYRFRCGIGRPQNKDQVISYVLGDFPTPPTQLINQTSKALQEFILCRDFKKLQEKIHSKAL